jgi:hypothetical protein
MATREGGVNGEKRKDPGDKKLEDILRLIELCRNIQSSSVNPFQVDIREKLLVLKKHLPDWNVIDVMLKDSEAMQQLVAIVKLQDQYIKHRASALYIDPLLLELKIQPIPRRSSRRAAKLAPNRAARPAPPAPWRAFCSAVGGARPVQQRFADQFGNYGQQTGLSGWRSSESPASSMKEEASQRSPRAGREEHEA